MSKDEVPRPSEPQLPNRRAGAGDPRPASEKRTAGVETRPGGSAAPLRPHLRATPPKHRNAHGAEAVWGVGGSSLVCGCPSPGPDPVLWSPPGLALRQSRDAPRTVRRGPGRPRIQPAPHPRGVTRAASRTWAQGGAAAGEAVRTAARVSQGTRRVRPHP